eukprot:scaffold3467_cov42-Attheya_sp.AAC.3
MEEQIKMQILDSHGPIILIVPCFYEVKTLIHLFGPSELLVGLTKKYVESSSVVGKPVASSGGQWHCISPLS